MTAVGRAPKGESQAHIFPYTALVCGTLRGKTGPLSDQITGIP